MALLIVGLVMLGIYYAIESQVAELEALEAARSTRSRAGSTVRKVDASRSRHAVPASDSTSTPVLPAAPDPPIGVAARRTRAPIADPDLPWLHPGLCVDDAGTSTETERARYLATFAPTPAWRTTLYVHPEAPAWALAAIRDNLESIERRATKDIGLPSTPPPIYLYPTVASLREHSCASAHAVAYYDGAIHLAVVESEPEDPGAVQRGPRLWNSADHELLTSLRHEYAHHVLISNGVGKPIWFQEGTAMAFAEDAPLRSYSLVHEHPVDVADMVVSFPKTSSLEDATRFYATAHVMMEFLTRLCLARVDCNPAELAGALSSRAASPQTLFEWATVRRGSDLAPTAERSLWDDYVAHQNFPPATYQALLARERPQPSDG